MSGSHKSRYDIVERPSSANSFESNRSSGYREPDYSYEGSTREPRSYGGGRNAGQSSGRGFANKFPGQAPRFEGGSSEGRGRWEMQDSKLMQKDVGQIGIDPASLAPLRKDFYVESASVAAMTAEEVEAFRKASQMSIKGREVPKPIREISDAGFPLPIVKRLTEGGITAATPIQAQGWTMALSGKNMVGIAQTGSGKTLSFILPALVHIKGQEPLRSGDGPIALVLAPTRELAVQIQDVARIYGNTVRVRNACVYGGAPKGPQIRTIQYGAELVIATPGRLIDLMEAGVCSLNRCSFLVLDEADRMLDMGFEPQIRQILSRIRLDRQVLMWSATWPKNVMRLAHDMLGRDFIQVNIGGAELLANNKIKQNVIVCEESDKENRLASLLMETWNSIPEPTEKGARKEMPRTIIFANKKRTVDDLRYKMRGDQWPAVAIHGDRSQNERDDAIRRFRSGELPILIATDVAARGLDVKNVKMVINYDFPPDTENYVHRIGRTARGSDAEGAAYSFVTSAERDQVPQLIKIMEDAGQDVPEELKALRPAPKRNYGGYGGGYQRGGYGGSSYGGGRGAGYGRSSGGNRNRY